MLTGVFYVAVHDQREKLGACRSKLVPAVVWIGQPKPPCWADWAGLGGLAFFILLPGKVGYWETLAASESGGQGKKRWRCGVVSVV